MKLEFLNPNEKEKLLEELKDYYGIERLPCLLLKTGKKKIRAFSGNLAKEQLQKLSQITNVEIIGMYIISKKDEIPRINFDALSLLKNQISKNIIEINEKQLQEWLRGYNLEIQNKEKIVVLKHGYDLVGVGKSNGENIFNYVPKERKLKTKYSNV